MGVAEGDEVRCVGCLDSSVNPVGMSRLFHRLPHFPSMLLPRLEGTLLGMAPVRFVPAISTIKYPEVAPPNDISCNKSECDVVQRSKSLERSIYLTNVSKACFVSAWTLLMQQSSASLAAY